MLVIRAPAVCGACKQVAAQGTVGGNPRCVSCALVGKNVGHNSVHTNGIVTALLGPMSSRNDNIKTARRKLAAQVGDDFADYNRYATQLREAIRTTGARTTQPMVRLNVVPWRVDGDTLAMHGNHLYEIWASKKSSEERRQFISDTAETLLARMAALRGDVKTYNSRTLLAEVLGPLDENNRSILPGLLSISDEVYDSMWEAIKHVNNVNAELQEALVRAWVSGLAARTATDISLGEAIDDANYALSEPLLYKFASRVLARSRVAADYLRDRYGASRMKQALDYPVSPDALAFATAVMTLADLKDKTLLKNVLDETVGKLGSALGLRTADPRREAASVMFTYLDALSSEKRVGAEVVDWAECDTIGADALQHVDASLLRKAKEALQKKTSDKQYSPLKLEKELLKLWGLKMARRWDLEKTADTFAEQLADAVSDQRQAVLTPSLWRNFVVAAGNEFYRDGNPLPAPPQAPKMTQDEFVGKNRGIPDWQVIGDQLINMSEYFNRRELQKQNIPYANITLLGPGGLKRLVKTKNYSSVMGDLQAVRRNLINTLQQVGSTEYTEKKTSGATYRAAGEVDEVMARGFQKLFNQLPDTVRDGGAVETFLGIMQDYKQEKGTPVQRRGNLITRFLKRK